MRKDEVDELKLMQRAYEAIRRSGRLTEDLEARLLKRFSARFENALELVRARRIRKYSFTPSGREIWIVKGRKGEYQVIPEANFCNCDDYYFRVLDRKRQMCYHYIAQRLAEALKMYETIKLPDSEYQNITWTWGQVLKRKP